MSVWYSLFVRSFADSNGDGVGDLPGLTSKIPYLQELGVTGIWLLPIHPAPSYHKYDVMNYLEVDPEYGTMSDFEDFIDTAHTAGIKVILDLVLNHTSNQHPWFIAAQKKNSFYRDWYVWKNRQEIPLQEADQWHLLQSDDEECYYGLFWSGMPDLNYDHPAVRIAAIDSAAFWLSKGVDGFRLDAAMHIFPPGREDDNHRWWQEFGEAVHAQKPNALLIGEIAESCGYIAPYLDNGLTAAFNFELAEHIIQAILTGKHDCMADWLKGVRGLYRETDPTVADAIFLSNHDQTRIATRLENDPKKIRLAASILLTFPGLPFLYYGEELGTAGDKPDEHLREPLIWKDGDPTNTAWITSKYPALSVTDALSDPDSLFYHYRQLIALRERNDCLRDGEIGLVDCSEPEVLLFTRDKDGKRVLVLHNLSDQAVLMQNHDEPKVRFSVLFETNEGCAVSEHEFHLPPYSTLLLEESLA